MGEVDQAAEAKAIVGGIGKPVDPSPGAPATGMAVATDKHGLGFDAELHQTKADGSPVLMPLKGKAGYRLLRRPGRKKKAADEGRRPTVDRKAATKQPPPGAPPKPGGPEIGGQEGVSTHVEAPPERQMASMFVDVVAGAGKALGAPPGEGEALSTDLYPHERRVLEEATEELIRKYNLSKPPPELVVPVTLAGFFFRCSRTEHGQARMMMLAARMQGIDLEGGPPIVDGDHGQSGDG